MGSNPEYLEKSTDSQPKISHITDENWPLLTSPSNIGETAGGSHE